jgi:glyoxylase-like metal-dependent hydrolase (beta-lactamase superfamily II)
MQPPKSTGRRPVVEIHQVKGRHVNSYIVIEAGGMFVVDVAWKGEKYVLGHITEVLRRSPAEVRLVTCTHGDPDHAGGVAELARACGAKVAYPYATHSFVNRFINDPTGILFRFATSVVESFRPRAWQMYANPQRSQKAQQLPALEPEDLMSSDHLEDCLDDEGLEYDYLLKNRYSLPGFDGWQTLHTPGHTWDSCCYYHQASGSLVTGDTLLGSKKKGKVVTASIYSNPLQLRRSVRRLRKLNPAAIYPGHGSVFHGTDLLEHL